MEMFRFFVLFFLTIRTSGVSILFKVGIYLVDVALRSETTKSCPSMYETIQKLRNIPKELTQEEPLTKGVSQINLKDIDLLKEHKKQVKKKRRIKSAWS